MVQAYASTLDHAFMVVTSGYRLKCTSYIRTIRLLPLTQAEIVVMSFVPRNKHCCKYDVEYMLRSIQALPTPCFPDSQTQEPHCRPKSPNLTTSAIRRVAYISILSPLIPIPDPIRGCISQHLVQLVLNCSPEQVDCDCGRSIGVHAYEHLPLRECVGHNVRDQDGNASSALGAD